MPKIPISLKRLLIGLAAAISFLVGCFASPALAEPAVTDARLGQQGELTRVVLDITERTTYKVFTLPDPYRVVVDLGEVEWHIPAGRVLQGRGLVAAMRYGLYKVGVSRIVLDLSGPADVSGIRFLEPDSAGNGLRLLIDLRAVEIAEFAAKTKKTLFASDILPGEGAAAGTATDSGGTAAAPAASTPSAGTGETALLPQPKPGTTPVPSEAPPVMAAVPQKLTDLLPIPKPGSIPKRKPLIVVDAGHGGIDPGALGNGAMEKNVTLAVAKALKAELEKSGQFRVVLTRSGDVFIPLRERFQIARDKGADLFISLHADSHADKSTRGASVYTLSEKASDAEAEALAAKENKSDVIAGVDLSSESAIVTSILIDLTQRETINLSGRFASLLVGEMRKDTLMVQNSHRFAGFAVLKAPDVPSVLIEMGYISSTQDERLLTSKKHQQRLASAIGRAIKAYFDWQEMVRKS